MPHHLILVRHGKSSWDNLELNDYDRPLSKRGFKNAPEMGKRLCSKNLKIDLLISSPALRAITTAEIIAKEIGYDCKNILEVPEIYNAELSQLFNLITSIDEYYQNVMMVGHNPGFTYFCNALSDAKIDNMPTCSIAHIELLIPMWSEVTHQSGKLVEFDYPKKAIVKPQ